MKVNNQEITCELIRSKRKTIGIQVKPDQTVVVRFPYGISEKKAMDFAKAHEDWIWKQWIRAGERLKERQILTAEEVKDYREKARVILAEKTARWARQMGVTYGRITIRQQKTRWGSCSAVGNLNYNWKLVLLPEPVMDYVVVHELAHRKEMNHSRRFWSVVEKELPDYKQLRRRLKDYEGKIDTEY